MNDISSAQSSVSERGFFRSLATSLLTPLIALSLFGAAIPSVRVTLERAQWFQVTPDEALHAEVIESLAQTGRYALWTPLGEKNPEVPKKGSLGALNLTTGPTLIVPAALLEKVTGHRAIIAARLVSVAYFLGTLILLFHIASHLSRQHKMNVRENLIAACSSVGFFFLQWRALQDTNYYSFAILGEGPAVFFVVLALWSGLKNRFTLMGAACSLAALSKPYFALLPFCLGVLIVMRLLIRGSRQERSRAFFWPTLIGLSAPIAFVLTAFLVTFGARETLSILRSYPAIMKAANGAGLGAEWAPSLHFFQSLILTKLHTLPTILKLRGVIFFVVGAFLSLRLSYRSRAFAPLIAFAWLHLIWWFFFTGATVSRYLMPAYLIFTLVNFIFVIGIMKKIMRAFTSGSTVILIIGISSMLGYHAYYLGLTTSKNWKNLEANPFYRQISAQNFWLLQLEDQSSTRTGITKNIPLLYSTSTSAYAHDIDYVISQPYEFSTKKLLNPIEPFPSDGWIVLGELPEPTWFAAIQKALEAGKCQSVAGVPYFIAGQRGFYACQSH